MYDIMLFLLTIMTGDIAAEVKYHSSGPGGVIAGVVVLILALSVAGVVTTIILVIVFKKRAKSGDLNLQSHNRHNQTIQNGISKFNNNIFEVTLALITCCFR